MRKIIGIVKTVPQQIQGNIKPTVASSGEEYKKGYESGYEVGSQEGFEKGFADGLDQGYADGYEAGNIINPEWKNFSYFCIGRPDLGSRLKYSDTANATTMAQMFFGYDTSVVPNADYIVPSLDTRNCINFNAMFNWGEGIVEIGLMDISKATTASSVQGMFGACSNLTRITFEKECIKLSISFSSSGKLDDVSIQSIFDGLAPVTTAQTLTLHNNVKILQSQVDNANAKGWTVAGATVVSEEEYNA